MEPDEKGKKNLQGATTEYKGEILARPEVNPSVGKDGNNSATHQRKGGIPI